MMARGGAREDDRVSDPRDPRSWTVRPAAAADRDTLYEICLLTGDAGDDATARYVDPELVGHVYVGPYLALQPELAFVVDDGTAARGYVLGALDSPAFERACEEQWWPALRHRYPRQRREDDDGHHWDGRLTRLIHAPPTAPADLVARYPSHLHIDVLPVAQGAGHGRALVETLADRLRAAGSPGVHLVVGIRNTRAQAFYAKVGFVEVDRDDGGITLARSLR
jgi:ribosomal protein S18 acetylase RimI-like enzyme